MKIFLWLTRIVASFILLQTLYFKFTAAPESVYIFEKLGAGAAGRIGSGVAELIVGVLLLLPKWTKYGSLGALGVISGAIISHLTILGIEVQGDGGTLFYLAIAVFICALANLLLTKEMIKILNFQI